MQLERRVEGDQRDGEVRGVRRHAVVASAEDGVRAVLTRDGRAPRAGRPLVARKHRVAEVRAAGALQEIASDRGHVANLDRGARAKGLRDDG
jgi:hypothetical protein